LKGETPNDRRGFVLPIRAYRIDPSISRSLKTKESDVTTTSTEPATPSADSEEPSALVIYNAACRALAEARSIDEVKDIRDQSIAMRAYAKQAKNRDLEANAVEIRLRATRRLDQLRQAQKETVGLNRGAAGGGEKDGPRGLLKNPRDLRPTLASQGIDKNLAHEGRKLGALSDEKFEQTIAESRDAVTRAVRKVVSATAIDSEADEEPAGGGEFITLKTHDGEDVLYQAPKEARFVFTTEMVSWAAWTWNPVTGCLHDCGYCYCPEIVNARPKLYPAGFKKGVFHHERLDAPAITKVPEAAKQDPRLKRVFVVSMGDLYGGWVPDEWIEKVHASCTANPQWDYLLLTKNPRRYVGLKVPPTAWAGATVDEQKRVRVAEDAFRQIKDVRVKWLSLEPLLEPLEFSDLSLFDWIVIGAQSATKQSHGSVPEFAPPFEWVARIVAQAREAGCRIYMKPNLLGDVHPKSPGMKLIHEQPAVFDQVVAPPVDDGIPEFLRRRRAAP
jgi:protein gp37